MLRTRLGRELFGIALILALAGVLNLAIDGLIFLGRYAGPVVVALGLLMRVIGPIAQKRWGSEGWFIRHSNRPRFVDESRRTDWNAHNTSLKSS
jgi:hypothetical protein